MHSAECTVHNLKLQSTQYSRLCSGSTPKRMIVTFLFPTTPTALLVHSANPPAVPVEQQIFISYLKWFAMVYTKPQQKCKGQILKLWSVAFDLVHIVLRWQSFIGGIVVVNIDWVKGSQDPGLRLSKVCAKNIGLEVWLCLKRYSIHHVLQSVLRS